MLFELKDELQEFFQEKNKTGFAKCFEDEKWLQSSAHFADIFHHMNQLNETLQRPGEKVFISSDKIISMLIFFKIKI